jgi:predicted amino acid dehydrogenase
MGTLATITGFPRGIIDLLGKKFVKSCLERKKPFIFSRLNGLTSVKGSVIDLIAVACPLLPEQMAMMDQKFVLGRIIEAVELAKKDGADIVVLGGFTSVVGNEGEEVAGAVDVAVTSGNSYTAALAVDGILRAASLLNVDLRSARCVVVGATGDIGSACTRFLAKKVGTVGLSARSDKKLEELAAKIRAAGSADVVVYRKTADAVRDADIIISATSALTTIIDAGLLRPGSIVCDVALPANIAREVSRARKDVLVFEGGLSVMPFYQKIHDRKWSALVPTNAIYGCLAEGLILGFEGVRENYSIGRGNITEEKMQRISKWGAGHGFGLSDFFCGDKFYSAEDMEHLKAAQAMEEANYATNR